MTNLKKGSTGSAVVTMQTMLIACGYSCGASGADGDFGKNTLAALTASQTSTSVKDPAWSMRGQVTSPVRASL